jgi:hypothetical protein
MNSACRCTRDTCTLVLSGWRVRTNSLTRGTLRVRADRPTGLTQRQRDLGDNDASLCAPDRLPEAVFNGCDCVMCTLDKWWGVPSRLKTQKLLLRSDFIYIVGTLHSHHRNTQHCADSTRLLRFHFRRVHPVWDLPLLSSLAMSVLPQSP